MPAQQLAARVLGEDGAAVKGVDDQAFRVGLASARRAAEQKVSGEVDAFDVQAGPARHFHVEQRERDRDAGPPIQDLVEETVPGIVVMDFIADEVQLVEQVVVQRITCA